MTRTAATAQQIETLRRVLVDARDNYGISSFPFTEDSGAQETHRVDAWVDDAAHRPSSITGDEVVRVLRALRALRGEPARSGVVAGI